MMYQYNKFLCIFKAFQLHKIIQSYNNYKKFKESMNRHKDSDK
jgi:hypothetical protein